MRILLVLALLGLGAFFLAQRVGEADLPEPLGGGGGGDRGGQRDDRRPPLRKARCPAGVADCRAVMGRIVYVERVDPDGDGDLHVVVADAGISAPGVTSIDVRPGLRPKRDPRLGDRATGAGPVQRGSFGQPQIHALRFRVRRERAG